MPYAELMDIENDLIFCNLNDCIVNSLIEITYFHAVASKKYQHSKDN